MEVFPANLSGNAANRQVNKKPTIAVKTVNRQVAVVLKKDQIKSEFLRRDEKIPRPANAFMIFANENRKKVAKQHPQESNKEISCRLGNQWKTLNVEQKEIYFARAKQLDAEHKRKYPNYVYNPKEARIRKAIRERERSMGAAAGGANGQGGSQRTRRSPHWAGATAAGTVKQPVHIASNLPDHLRKDLRTELEQGFLMNTSPYVYQAQHYPISTHPDYANYLHIGASHPWLHNGYVSGNQIAQQQIWNQYQPERVRMHPAPPENQSYTIPQEQSQVYQNQSHQNHQAHQNHQPLEDTRHQIQMPPMMQIKDIQNSSNPHQDVNAGYMNIESTDLSSIATVSNSEIKLGHIQETRNQICEAPLSNGLVGSLERNCNGGEIPEVDRSDDLGANINLGSGSVNCEENFEITESLFQEGMGNLETEDTNKNKIPVTILKSIPIAHSNNPIQIPEYSPFQPVNMTQNKSPEQIIATVPNSNNYYMEFLTPEFQMTIQQDSNGPKKSFEMPIELTTQKYYDSFASGNFDIPVISAEQYNAYLHEDGYGYVSFPSHEIQTFSYPHYDFAPVYEESRNMNNKVDIENCILDLSKIPSHQQNDEDHYNSARFALVSARVCDELAEII